MTKCRFLIAMLLILALLSVFLTGCAGKEEQPVPPDKAETPEPVEAADPPAADPSEEVAPVEETEDDELNDPNRDWEPIETKFGRLRYPDQFIDYIETEQQETDSSVQVLFRAVIGEKRIDLFEIGIGKGTGENVGSLTGPDGVKRDVFLQFFEIDDLSDLTEGETDRVYAMQESLNFVIDNLR